MTLRLREMIRRRHPRPGMIRRQETIRLREMILHQRDKNRRVTIILPGTMIPIQADQTGVMITMTQAVQTDGMMIQIQMIAVQDPEGAMKTASRFRPEIPVTILKAIIIRIITTGI